MFVKLSVFIGFSCQDDFCISYNNFKIYYILLASNILSCQHSKGQVLNVTLLIDVSIVVACLPSAFSFRSYSIILFNCLAHCLLFFWIVLLPHSDT